KSCSASSNKNSQTKNSSSYFSFGWTYYRRCKLLNTVYSGKGL
ncbi:hypothetical protein HMPREF1352_00996, partial [Enterococcus faecium 511]